MFCFNKYLLVCSLSKAAFTAMKKLFASLKGRQETCANGAVQQKSNRTTNYINVDKTEEFYSFKIGDLIKKTYSLV